MKTKDSLRKKQRNIRNTLPICLENELIFKQLIALSLFSDATIIGSYYPYENEVNIEHNLYQTNKKIAYPYIQEKSLYFLGNVKKTKTTTFGLTTPVNTKETPIVKPDLLLVPAIAVNKQGYRLGYGGGYYDRYLHQHKIPTICLIYDIQLIDESFQDFWDIKMDYIITEKRIFDKKNEHYIK